MKIFTNKMLICLLTIAFGLVSYQAYAGGRSNRSKSKKYQKQLVCGNGIVDEGETKMTCPRDTMVKRISIFEENAAHADFSPDGTQIVYDQVGEDGFYDVLLVGLDGSEPVNLTHESNVPQRHNGWPVWHPSGKYIIFQSEAPVHLGSNRKALKHIGSPKSGTYNNLYATTPYGDQFWKLTDVAIKQRQTDGIPAMSVVNAKFSRDGSKMLWSERYDKGGVLNWGLWRVRIADFKIVQSGPLLRNVRTLIKAEDVCRKCNYVNAMSFSKDGSKVLLAGNLDGQHVYGMDQYWLELETGKLTNLLSTPQYWEEGACVSPAEQKIIYHSNVNSSFKLDLNDKDWPAQPRTGEWWIMDSDGVNKQPLSFFNVKGSPEYQRIGRGKRVITAQCGFSPDGKAMLGIIGVDHSSRSETKTLIKLNIGLLEFR